MCGIIAAFDPERREVHDAAHLRTSIQKGLDYIAHRGPDASCVWVNADSTCGKSSISSEAYAGPSLTQQVLVTVD